jgi:hypothetical protein
MSTPAGPGFDKLRRLPIAARVFVECVVLLVVVGLLAGWFSQKRGAASAAPTTTTTHPSAPPTSAASNPTATPTINPSTSQTSPTTPAPVALSTYGRQAWKETPEGNGRYKLDVSVLLHPTGFMLGTDCQRHLAEMFKAGTSVTISAAIHHDRTQKPPDTPVALVSGTAPSTCAKTPSRDATATWIVRTAPSFSPVSGVWTMEVARATNVLLSHQLPGCKLMAGVVWLLVSRPWSDDGSDEQPLIPSDVFSTDEQSSQQMTLTTFCDNK